MTATLFQGLLANVAAQAPTEVIVGAEDLQAILPALILFASGAIVLLFDVFTRSLTGTVLTGTLLQAEKADAGGMTATLHFIALLGTAIAGAFVCAAFESSKAQTFFTGAVRVDTFTNSISALIIVGAFLSLLVSIDYLRRHRSTHGEFHCLVLWAAGSMILFVQSNNLVMAFLSLETMSMAVYILTSFFRDSRRSVEGGLKYFVLGGFSTGFLLFGFTLLYGATRQIEFGAMTAALSAGTADVPLLLAGLVLSLIGLAFKVGAFPFHSWVPDAYEGAPTVTTGFMAVTVKVAGFAVLLRLVVGFGTGGDLDLPNGSSVTEILSSILSALAITTMIFGNFVALVQKSVKRMLAYSAIGHTGYLLIGVVAALSPGAKDDASAAILFYLLPYSLMTVGAFALLAYCVPAQEAFGGTGSASDGTAEDHESFDDYRGLSQQRPVLAFLLLVLMVSFAGIPPTAGFWAKLYLFRVAIQTDHVALAVVGVLTSVVSVGFYLRLVVSAYMQPAEQEFGGSDFERRLASGLVIAAAAIAVILLGLFPEAALELTASSAGQVAP